MDLELIYESVRSVGEHNFNFTRFYVIVLAIVRWDYVHQLTSLGGYHIVWFMTVYDIYIYIYTIYTVHIYIYMYTCMHSYL